MKLISILLLSTFCFVTKAQKDTPSYKIENAIQLEGNGSWDLLTVDEANNRLFVSHQTLVHVIDLKTGKQLATINDTKGVHGIALAPDINKGFTSNAKDSTVTVFDLLSLRVLSKIKVTGAKADAILYDKFTQRVFVFNGKSSNATVIDVKTNSVIATIALEGKPELTANDEKGNIYVNIETKNAIAVINSSTLKVERMIALHPGEEPSGLAIDNIANRLFSVCGNKMLVILDAKTGKTLSTLPIGAHCDGVVFDAVKKRIYTSNGEGTITVIQQENENTFKVVETIKTQKGAKTIAFNSVTHKLFLPVAEFGDTPKPSKEEPEPKPAIKPGTFKIMEITVVN